MHTSICRTRLCLVLHLTWERLHVNLLEAAAFVPRSLIHAFDNLIWRFFICSHALLSKHHKFVGFLSAFHISCGWKVGYFCGLFTRCVVMFGLLYSRKVVGEDDIFLSTFKFLFVENASVIFHVKAPAAKLECHRIRSNVPRSYFSLYFIIYRYRRKLQH